MGKTHTRPLQTATADAGDNILVRGGDGKVVMPQAIVSAAGSHHTHVNGGLYITYTIFLRDGSTIDILKTRREANG